MSKLIVEMEMPQACPCEFADYSSHGIFRPCFAWNGIPARWHEVEKCAENGTRPSWCPIKGELVLCGDCKHYDGKWCLLLDMVNSDMGNWFCAYGERKDGEHDTER